MIIDIYPKCSMIEKKKKINKYALRDFSKFKIIRFKV